MNDAVYSRSATSLRMTLAKSAALLCDQILIDPLSPDFDGPPIDNFAMMLAGGMSDESLLTNRDFRNTFVFMREVGDVEQLVIPVPHEGTPDYPVIESVMRNARSMSRAEWERAGTTLVDYPTRKALAQEISRDFAMLERLSTWVERPVALPTCVHARLLADASRDWSSTASVSRQLDAHGVIDFGSLSWRDVLRLRKSRFREEFRHRLADIASSEDPNVMSELWHDLWRFASETKPSHARTTVTGIVGNLPVPFPVNPISIISSFAQMGRDSDMRSNYGWLFFLIQANPLLTGWEGPQLPNT